LSKVRKATFRKLFSKSFWGNQEELERTFYHKLLLKSLIKSFNELFAPQKVGGIRINLKLKGAKPPAVWKK